MIDNTTPQPRASWLRLAIDDLRHRPSGNVPALDLLRCVAILLVLFQHTGEKFGLLSFGWTGVDLFFILSGFLIGGQLIKELRRTGTLNVGIFILRRGLRIWPLYYFWVVALLVMAYLEGKESLLDQVRNFAPDLLCVSNYFGQKLLGGWSLSTEEQFYVAVPLVLLFATKFVSTGRLILLPIAWLVIQPLLRISVLRAGSGKFEVYTPFHLHSEGLALGLLFAWVSPYVLALGWRKCLLVCTSVVPIVLSLRWLNHDAFTYTGWTYAYGAATLLALQVPARAMRALEWKGIYILSRLSYGVYLNHRFLIEKSTALAQKFAGLGLPGFVIWSMVALMLSMGIAFLTFAVVEAPFLRMRDRWLEARRAKVNPAHEHAGQELVGRS